MGDTGSIILFSGNRVDCSILDIDPCSNLLSRILPNQTKSDSPSSRILHLQAIVI